MCPHSLCLFNHLCMLIVTHVYLFYSLGLQSNTGLFILVLKEFQLWPMGPLSGGLLCCLDMPQSFVFCQLPYFLLLQGTPDFSFILFPALTPELTISPRIPSSFYWKMVFGNQEVGSAFVLGCGGVIVSRSS